MTTGGRYRARCGVGGAIESTFGCERFWYLLLVGVGGRVMRNSLTANVCARRLERNEYNLVTQPTCITYFYTQLSRGCLHGAEHEAESLSVRFGCHPERTKFRPPQTCSSAHDDQVTRAADRKGIFLSERVIKIVHKVGSLRKDLKPFRLRRKNTALCCFLLFRCSLLSHRYRTAAIKYVVP